MHLMVVRFELTGMCGINLMIEGRCHCGNVKIKVSKLPESLTLCNCSLCTRIVGLWGYYQQQEVSVSSVTPTSIYCWGNRYMNFHHCTICGCVTHYMTTEKLKSEQNREWAGVNFRMMDSKEIQDIPIKHFDGAVSFKYI